jgi:molybdopterin-guanine dinucleotide biosynthesis protein A
VADPGLTGILLVGGASSRFGAPKALARLGGETLAERAWRLLGETCDETIAVGKRADALPLPFPVLDDGSPVRAPIAGLVAGLRAARNDVAVVLPVDVPLLSARSVEALAAACADAAAPPTGPLPGAYRKSALPAFEQRLATGRLALRDALRELDTRVVELDPWELANVNTPADLEAVTRRDQVLAAAAEAAAAHGLHALEPRILADSNDTIVHLRPEPLVARVATSPFRVDPEAELAREVAVARAVAERGGPALGPAVDVPAGPHRARGLLLTFWPYVDGVGGEPSPAELAVSLRALHEALPAGLPPLATTFDRTAALELPELREDDRSFLAAAVRDLRRRLDALRLPERPLHGGPHRGNLLGTRDGVRWIDLATACRGPLEWDLAFLPPEAAAAFPELDLEALEIASLLVSACVATWCWAQYGRAPEVDDAARFHLRRLRDELGTVSYPRATTRSRSAPVPTQDTETPSSRSTSST